jgi:uncharacterized protein YkwD
MKDYLSPLEQKVIAQMNLARTNPAAWAANLESRIGFYNGKMLQVPGEIPIRTNEGVKAVEEAIRFLRAARSLRPLKVSRGLSLAAKDHVKDQGPKGLTGHSGSDGSDPFARMNRYGQWQRAAGENISYGDRTAEDIVLSLIIDDGVRSRGHRKNMFNPDYLITGVAFGEHVKYGAMCAISYAKAYRDAQ